MALVTGSSHHSIRHNVQRFAHSPCPWESNTGDALQYKRATHTTYDDHMLPVYPLSLGVGSEARGSSVCENEGETQRISFGLSTLDLYVKSGLRDHMHRFFT